MSTVTLKATLGARVDPANSTQHYAPTAYYSNGNSLFTDDQSILLFRFVVPDEYKYKSFGPAGDSCKMYIYAKVNQPGYGSSGSRYISEAHMLYGDWDPATVTYETRPTMESGWSWLSAWDPGTGTPSYDWRTVYLTNSDLEDLLVHGFALKSSGHYSSTIATSAATSSYQPYIQVIFGDTQNYIKPTGNPTSGYIDPRNSFTLRWSNSVQLSSLYAPEQVSAVVTWKESGSETEHTISVTTAQTVTIPANTWSAGSSYQWKVAVTDSGGTTTETQWYTLSTSAGTAVASIINPRLGKTVDGSLPITFEWQKRDANNYTSTDIEIKKSTAGSAQITDHVSATSGVQTYTLPARTLSAGSNVWRVRPYNIDDVAGNWTGWASFTVISSPDEPFVEATTVSPRPEIAWQGEGQIAWQVQIGTYDSGQRFGYETSFKCPVYLPDGDTMVRVRIMNEFNLWSEWSTIYITIQNDPGETPIVLTATEAEMSSVQVEWNAVPDATGYQLFRNGQAVTTLTETAYVDRWALGETTYTVHAFIGGDNYADSNEATVSVAPPRFPIICERGGEWIELRYTTQSVPTTQTSIQQSVAMAQFSGEVYPVPEISKHRMKSYMIDVAFKNGESGPFEALLGKECVLKDHFGELVHGVMAGMTIARNRFYTVISAELQQMGGAL